MPIIAIALAIAAVLGGGTAAVAQASLPGDALWGFKIHVNEGLKAVLTTDTKSRADADIAAIQTRLTEAQTLATHGMLTANEQAIIQTNIAAHAQGIATAVYKLQAQGDAPTAAQIAARYQAAIAAGVGPLAKAQANANAGASVSLAPLISEVRAALDAATTLSAQTNVAAAVQAR
ncbi:MAG: hypothetical protein V4474_00330 [Patescibacteria group bacterium]